MKKFLQFLRKILYQVYEKNGQIKIGVAIILIIILVAMFRITGYNYPIWWQLALIPGAYIGVFSVIGLIYAWIIWPGSLLLNWIKKKRNK